MSKSDGIATAEVAREIPSEVTTLEREAKK